MRKSLRIASMVLAALLFFSYDSLKAQVKIGGNPASIDPAAILELESTRKGLLLPRVDDAGMAAISNSANAGFLVYYIGGGPAGVAGLFVKTGGVGGAMVRVTTEGGLGGPWKQDGNLGTAGSFLGTTNNFPLDFKTNGATRLTIGADGKLVFAAGVVDDAVPATDGNNVLVLATDGTVKKRDLAQSSVTSLNALKGDLEISLMDNAGIAPEIVTAPPVGATPGRIELSFPTLTGQVIAGNTPTYGFMHIDDYTKLQDLMAADGIKVLPPLTVANAVAEGAVFTKNGNKWELALSPATETTAGIVTLGAQTFVGDKTFSNQKTIFDGSVEIKRVNPASGAPTLLVEGATTLKSVAAQTLVNTDNYNLLLQDPSATGDAQYELKKVTVPGWKLTSTGIGQISTTSPTPAVGDATGNLAFATATTGTDFAVTSTGSTVTFALPNASTADRGVVSTGAQEFGGDKSFAGKVHVGAAFGTPQVSPSNLIVNGSVGVKFRTAPAGSTIGPDDYIVLIAAAGAATTISLPNATECSGRIYVIKRIPGTNPATEEDNNVVVNTTGGQTINGIASTTISVVHTSITVMSDGTNWQMLSRGTGF
ncbi:hypothetical protein AAHN97_18855 [Chitinophaga niabensis]|uniref:hypothetical protein n=1 Tax=Chitinophaga niabensis TaxID=536979 RepID=UPI0031BB28E5